MPVFELEDPSTGKVYEVEAPDARRAIGAFKQFQPEPTSAPQAATKYSEPGAAERLLRYTPIGSWLDEIGAGGDAAINWATGGRAGRPYEDALAARQEAQRASDAAHPIRNTIEGAVGAVVTAPLLPVVRAFQGAAMLPQVANSALTGLGYGALFGAGEGEPGDRSSEAAAGGAIGATIGAVTPPVVRGLGNVANAAANYMRPLPAGVDQFSHGATSRVARAVGDDDVLNTYARQAQELGPEGMLADMGPNLRGQASAIATQPGAGQRTIVNALETRAQGAQGRIAADVDATLGPSRNLVQVEENIVNQSRAQAAPHYDRFYQTPVPVTSEIQALIPRIEASGVLAGAQRLAQIEGHRSGQQITGREWDYMKRAADDLARAAAPGSNEQRLYQALARDVRNTVDNAISPGQPDASPWAIAREISGDGMQFREGLEEGAGAFARGVHPDRMAADLAQMPHVQRMGYNEGARGQIRDIMGNAATAQGEQGATAARRALGSDYARQKIALVAGQPGAPTTRGPFTRSQNGQAAADQLTGRLDAETAFANTRQQAYQGSQTQARKAAQQEFPSNANTSAANEVGKKTATGYMMEGVYRLANFLVAGELNARRARVASDAARMLVAQGASRDAIAQGLRQFVHGQNASTRATREVERFISHMMSSGRQGAIAATVRDDPQRYLDTLERGAR